MFGDRRNPPSEESFNQDAVEGALTFLIESGITGELSVVNSPTLTGFVTNSGYIAIEYTPASNQSLTAIKVFTSSATYSSLTLEIRAVNTTGTLIYSSAGRSIDSLGTTNYIAPNDCQLIGGTAYVIMFTGLPVAAKIVASTSISPTNALFGGVYFNSPTIDTTATMKFSLVSERSGFTINEILIMKYLLNGVVGRFAHVSSYGGTVGLNAIAMSFGNLILRNINPLAPVNMTSQTRTEGLKASLWGSNNGDPETWTDFSGRQFWYEDNKTLLNTLVSGVTYRLGETDTKETEYQEFNTTSKELDKNNKYSNQFMFTNNNTSLDSLTSNYSSGVEIQVDSNKHNTLTLNNLSGSKSYDNQIVLDSDVSATNYMIRQNTGIGYGSLDFVAATSNISNLWRTIPPLSVYSFDTYQDFAMRIYYLSDIPTVNSVFSSSNDGGQIHSLNYTGTSKYQCKDYTFKSLSNNQKTYSNAINCVLDGATGMISSQSRTASCVSHDNNNDYNLEFYSGSTSGTSLSKQFTVKSTGGIFAYGMSGSSDTNADVRYNITSKEIYYDTSALKYKTIINDNMNAEMLITSNALFDPLAFHLYSQIVPEPIYRNIYEVIMIDKLDEDGVVERELGAIIMIDESGPDEDIRLVPVLDEDGEVMRELGAIIQIEASGEVIGLDVVNQDKITELENSADITGLIADYMPDYAIVRDENGEVESIDHKRILYLALIQIKEQSKKMITLNNNYNFILSRIDELVSLNSLIENP